MNAHCRMSPDPDDLDVAVYASLVRVLESVSIERKLGVFHLMARTAAAQAEARRQQMIDDLWSIAEQIGLVDRLGAVDVRATLAMAFAR